MSSSKLLISLIAFVVVIGLGGGYILLSKDSDDNASASESTSLNTANTSNTSPGTFTSYDEALLANADDGDVVLFFQASWCITCKSLERNILKEQDQIPEDLTILTLDFDSEKELKNKYGVTVQHTLVQVDAQGELVTKWIGGNTLETITDQIV